MTDSDTFAAAALTGLIANGDYSVESTPTLAWRMADAMLRERERTFDAKPRELSDDQRTLRNAADLLGPGGFKNLANELLSLSRRLKNHDAAPAAIANAESVAPQPTAGDRSGNPTSHSGTGKQPAPPCVETDGFSSGSRTGPIIQPPERQSPDRECEESSLRDVSRPDTKGKAAGGPEHHISDRSQPVKDCVSDRSKPINDNRLSALEELSAMDQELELKHGITGNPMIKARRNKESAGAGITNAGPRLRQMNDVLKENERLRGQLAWTERERDSLRVSINNLRDYVSEFNAELFAASAAKTDTTPQRNGALSDSPDPDSRVWETPRTPPPQATPQQGSVQGEGSFRDSQNAKEPVAWAVETGGELEASFCGPAGREDADDWREQSDGVIVPLYRSPTLTDAERSAIKEASEFYIGTRTGVALGGLLERLK